MPYPGGVRYALPGYDAGGYLGTRRYSGRLVLGAMREKRASSWRAEGGVRGGWSNWPYSSRRRGLQGLICRHLRVHIAQPVWNMSTQGCSYEGLCHIRRFLKPTLRRPVGSPATGVAELGLVSAKTSYRTDPASMMVVGIVGVSPKVDSWGSLAWRGSPRNAESSCHSFRDETLA